jgi:hypothetical protein
MRHPSLVGCLRADDQTRATSAVAGGGPMIWGVGIQNFQRVIKKSDSIMYIFIAYN